MTLWNSMSFGVRSAPSISAAELWGISDREQGASKNVRRQTSDIGEVYFF